MEYCSASFVKHYLRLVGATCEALISINHQLDLPEAAAGVLHYAQNIYHIELKESWYEKLQRWETALQIYETKQVCTAD